MAEEARLTSFRRTLMASAAAVAVVATGMTLYLDQATQHFAEAGSGGSLAVPATPSPRIATRDGASEGPWASPRAMRIDMTPTGSIARPEEQPRFKNVVTDPSAGMPQ
ncbi:hypothetical protein [Methylocella sp. CPCC 101449]|jgi:hypothetical protein|uniref:hypothetical protein n=1 Tax=Methylocella sp. CPCC 101449 TaxID=2987531 RepID=UPI00288F9EE0|nr:hypothetical protein [Methylocella sp. CPCC 101449]MDT2021470.1 hypothetical protein [Methylocella sp. CPCC 101449]HEV2571562.1 hypothetical protein [Beijerinckiaceae bacterium]